MRRLPALVAGVVVIGVLPVLAQPGGAEARQFSPGTWSSLEELPAGPFRDRLNGLPPQARERARDWLRRFHFPEADLPSLRADREGGIYYVCQTFAATGSAEMDAPIIAAAPVPVGPLPSSLIFHSRPGAPNVLYLNFTGETVTSTAWNNEVGRTSIPAVAFSTDGDHTTFSDSEQLAIKRIWQRVAEDYAPFDMDVTTERPASFTSRTAHLLITRNTDANGQPNPSSAAGGVAYVDVFNGFNYDYYRPAWVYHNNLGNNEANIAEAGSHEIGHNLGLSHDGRTGGTEYYGGHGSGDTSWGPLMGTGYYRNVSQWCQGDYYLANNTQDDLSILAGKTAYRADDHADTRTAATPVALSGLTNLASTTPETDPDNLNSSNKGVLETSTDMDVFSFATGSGPVRLAVNPWITPSGTRGGNLDVLLELRDAGGGLIATNNPTSTTTALIQTNLPQGLYFLHVRQTGTGNPLSTSPSGYTTYGSVGQYFLSGYVTDPSGLVIPPVAELAVNDLTEQGASSHLLTVTYSDNVAIQGASLDSLDVRVRGPRGYDRLAQFVSVNAAGDGSPRVVTYAAPAPHGATWSQGDNGLYSVWMEPVQVTDVEGAAVASSPLGEFRVVMPTVVYAADMDTNPGWTLDSQWQYGPPNYSSGGPAGGFTGTSIIGYNLSGTYGNNISPTRYATTPAIDCSGASSLTLRFQRWLELRSRDTATIEVSADGVNWLGVWSTSSTVADTAWNLQQYALPAGVAGSGAVRVRWGLGSGISGTDLGWHVDDVEILAVSPDMAAPAAGLLVEGLTSGGASTHPCTVTYTDATAVSLATLDHTDLRLTGPTGYSAAVTFLTADVLVDSTPVVAGYAIPAPGGQWGWEDNGTYTLVLQAGEVGDVYGNASLQATLGSFVVSIPEPGRLEVSPAGSVASAGTVGGPFAPASFDYTLTNAGDLALNWVAGANSPWLTLSPTAGTLEGGATAKVTVSLIEAAASLDEGNYAGTCFFQNTSGGGGSTTRQVNLTVEALPAFELLVTASPAMGGTVVPAGGSFVSGATVQLQAVPADYFVFDQWTGDMATSDNPLLLTVVTNLSLNANFTEVLTSNYPTPLWWLASYGYTNEVENAVTNLGANGMPLWQSYIAGLVPTNPASQLVLGVESVAPFVLGWQTVSGRLYSVSRTTNELVGFEVMADAVDLPWTMQRLTNDSALPAALYRLEVRKP